ncbi:MAG TPA: anti-sigma factor [Solirubrobacteraceae bacterium]
MSDGDTASDTRGCGGEVAAYALGALDPAEVDTFRRHLETCSVCRDELAAFESVVRVLPLSTPAHRAPAELRRNVMHAIASEPKSAPAARTATRRAPTRWRLPRPALGLAAALAVAAAAFVGINAAGSGTPATRIIHAQVTGQGSAELRLSGDHGELVVNHFSPPPTGQIYEVWLKRGTGSPKSIGLLFSPTAAGQANVDVPGSLHGVSLVMVTPEPAGGSPRPTHSAVISAPLT